MQLARRRTEALFLLGPVKLPPAAGDRPRNAAQHNAILILPTGLDKDWKRYREDSGLWASLCSKTRGASTSELRGRGRPCTWQGGHMGSDVLAMFGRPQSGDPLSRVEQATQWLERRFFLASLEDQCRRDRVPVFGRIGVQYAVTSFNPRSSKQGSLS